MMLKSLACGHTTRNQRQQMTVHTILLCFRLCWDVEAFKKHRQLEKHSIFSICYTCGHNTTYFYYDILKENIQSYCHKVSLSRECHRSVMSIKYNAISANLLTWEECHHQDTPLAHSSQVFSLGNCVMTFSTETGLTK